MTLAIDVKFSSLHLFLLASFQREKITSNSKQLAKLGSAEATLQINFQEICIKLQALSLYNKSFVKVFLGTF